MRNINLVKSVLARTNGATSTAQVAIHRNWRLLVIKAVLMCTGIIITVYGESGRAVQISSSNNVVLSADGEGATASAFKLVVCLASDTVSASIRPTCVSLMDARHPYWYVRHRNYFLRVDLKNSTNDLWLFKRDSSFIVHPRMFHQGTYMYALESVNYPEHYVSSQGRTPQDCAER